MSFIPSNSTFYRIVVKHTNKPIAVLGGQLSAGALVGQETYDAAKPWQLFKLRRLNTFYYAITAKHSGKNLDVPNAGTNDGGQIVQWYPSDDQGNEQFRFDRAGDGWYYIVAQHSGKCLAVHNAQADGTALVQWTKQVAPHFMFRFVPEGQVIDTNSGRTLITDSNARMRLIIIGIAGKVPEIGSGLGPLLTLLWPDDSPSRLWDQMKDYVSALLGELIEQQKIEQLSLKLAGLRNMLHTYEKEEYGSKRKAGAFDSLLGALDEAEPMFFSPIDPVRLLPFFVAMGTIRLAALREECVSYQRIYLETDNSAAQHLATLKEKTVAYKTAAEKARDSALAWRLAKISVSVETTKTFGALGPVTTYTWFARDAYDGWNVQWSYATLGGGEFQAEEFALRAKADRESAIRAQFSADLDRVLGPSRLWLYLDPSVTATPTQVATEVEVGPYGANTGTAFADSQPGRITTVFVYAGSRVDGIEFFYNGVSGGLHGARGGNTYRLDLDSDETIVGAWGRAGDAVDALYFETSKGRRVGGGGGGGVEFIGEVSDDLNATLARIKGRQATQNLQSITFVWSYLRDQ